MKCPPRLCVTVRWGCKLRRGKLVTHELIVLVKPLVLSSLNIYSRQLKPEIHIVTGTSVNIESMSEKYNMRGLIHQTFVNFYICLVITFYVSVYLLSYSTRSDYRCCHRLLGLTNCLLPFGVSVNAVFGILLFSNLPIYSLYFDFKAFILSWTAKF